jgi:hypothetical protein
VRDLTENARFELSIISTDKRSLREQENFYLNELVFDTPYEFKVFTINDVLQIRIRDVQETFATMKLAEMPFFCDTEELLRKRTYEWPPIK